MRHAVSGVCRNKAAVGGRKGLGSELGIPRQRITPGRPGTGLSALLRLIV